ncbi:hypothetical protein [Clostridium felsineum]|uniref:hypothetical protein n=1 Tax=Clostridium felsineum TaxID=36839 RepID=UPI0009D3DD3C|nr:hypothetical protein [Clostridium felsineum]URZ15087.1 hypothetical protein CLFE_011040 [Clostridium felsineum DSM 794]
MKTGNPIGKLVAGLGEGTIQFAGGMGQLDVYDMGKAVYTLLTNLEAQAQFKV